MLFAFLMRFFCFSFRGICFGLVCLIIEGDIIEGAFLPWLLGAQIFARSRADVSAFFHAVFYLLQGG